MHLDNEAHDLERIEKAFRLISKEIRYCCLASVLLSVAIKNSGAARGTVLLSDGGELLAKAESMTPSRKLLISKRELECVGARLETSLDPSMPRIDADRIQLRQVIFDLVRNASDAMAYIDGRGRMLKASAPVTAKHP